MDGNKFRNLMCDQIGHLYNNNDMSDCTIFIYETPMRCEENIKSPAAKKRKPSKKNSMQKNASSSFSDPAKESSVLFSSIKAHSLILSTQCDYFKKMIYESTMTESQTKELKLYVNKSEGKYMALMIRFFYNHNVFENYENPLELIDLLPLADRLCCDDIIKHISKILQTIEFPSIDSCEKFLQSLNNMNLALEAAITSKNDLITYCGAACAKILCPLEIQNVTTHIKFQLMSFELLLCMLKSKKPITFHENSTVFYIELWLKYEITRQTEENIRLLLKEVLFMNLSLEFLMDVVTERNEIFNIWSGFKDWLICVIGSLSIGNGVYYIPNKDLNINRNFKSKSIANSYRFTVYKSGSSYFGDDTFFVYKGYHLFPKIFTKDLPEKKDYSNVFLSIIVENFEKINFFKDSNKACVKLNYATTFLPKNIVAEPQNIKEYKTVFIHRTITVKDHINRTGYLLGLVQNQSICKLEEKYDLLLTLKEDKDSWPSWFSLKPSATVWE